MTPRSHSYGKDAVAVGLTLGFVADRVIGDPQRFHPVAGFGSIAAALQRPLYADSRVRGLLYETILVGGTIGVGVLAARLPWRTWVVAAATWAVLGGRSLEREAGIVHDLVCQGDIDAARQRVRSLVGRDPSALDADGLGRACLESIAENTSDAVVAPLTWGVLGGVPGLVGYRAVNTLDAMIGHRTPRWERFGWAAAKVDDVANLLPSRLATGLTAALSGRPREVLAVVRRDAAKHPSPNAGPIESAFAATLGVRLGGSNVYGGVVEDRGTLGDGSPARIDDIPRAVSLSRRLSWATLGGVLTARLVVRSVLGSWHVRSPKGD